VVSYVPLIHSYPLEYSTGTHSTTAAIVTVNSADSATLVLVPSPMVMKNLITCGVALGKNPTCVKRAIQPEDVAVTSLPAVIIEMPLLGPFALGA